MQKKNRFGVIGAVAVAIVSSAIQVNAISFDDALGWVYKSAPSFEAEFINFMRTLDEDGEQATLEIAKNANKTDSFTVIRFDDGPDDPLPEATWTNYYKDDSPSGDGEGNIDHSFGSTDYAYVLAKYANYGVVWYLGGIQDSTLEIPEYLIPSLGGEHRISHYSLFNPVPRQPPQNTVITPDGGMTLILMGMVLSGIGLLRKKIG